VKAFKESGGGSSFGKNRVPERQVRNLARGYAWCVAKEGVTLSILKVSFAKKETRRGEGRK